MTTIKELIEQLLEIEDKDQSVIYEYYLAENFEYANGIGQVTKKVFAKFAQELSDVNVFSDTYEYLNNELFAFHYPCDLCAEYHNEDLSCEGEEK